MKKMRTFLLIMLCCLCIHEVQAQPAYTANDLVSRYEGGFRPGLNLGIYAPWTDEQLGDLAAGNPDIDLPGVGAKAIRPALYEHFVAQFGYDLRVPTYEHYDKIGLKDNTLLIGFPSDARRDPTEYCPGVRSELFANLYLDIWDNGENGTPVNDQNHYALYLYRLLQHYGPYVRFWEIWNEPGFDYTGAKGWAPPGTPGNWWENNPDPCDYKLRAPIYHYIRILRISWEVIKTIAPEDYVVVSGVGYPSFLDALLRNTDNPRDGSTTSDHPLKGGAYFDVMGYHAYPHFDGSLRYWDNNIQDFAYERHSDAAAEGLINSQQAFQEVLSDRGYNGQTYPRKHWMITECNIPRRAFDEYIGSTIAQRNFVSKAAILCQMNDILQLHIYKIGEETSYDQARQEFELMGLYEKLEGLDPYFAPLNESGISYKTTSDQLFGKTYDPVRTAAMQLPADVQGGAFQDAYGAYTYALWARTQEDRSEADSATYSFPAAWNLGQLVRRDWDHGISAKQTITSAEDLLLTASPSFFTEQAFSMSQSEGCLPLEVQFEDGQMPSGLQRLWTFEGGQPATSTAAAPQVRYETAGTFEARLEWRDANGQVVFRQSSQLLARAGVEAAFDSYQSGPIVRLNNLTGLTADEFLWDFGNGQSSTEPNPTQVYYQSGSYDITLTVRNECGESSERKRFEVQVPDNDKALLYTANDTIVPYQGQFRPGVNLGAYRLWSDKQLADISAGNIQKGIDGVGARSLRPLLDEKFLEKWGYDIRLDEFQHYVNLDLQDNTLMVGFPSDAHRDPNFYCATDQSELFDQLYLDIWDNGENGTPVNDDNYYALYLYKTVTRYKDFVKFWEIWNEPSFDYAGHGWKQPGLAGNWWENNPHPCDYKLRAPIFHYIRILRISYEVIKKLDPDAYVALSGVAYGSFLDAILRNTDNPLDGSIANGYEHRGGAYFDVMGFHTYPHFDGSTRYYDIDLQRFVNQRHSDAAIGGISRLQDDFTQLLESYGYDGQRHPRKYWIITEANAPRKAFGIYFGSSEVQRNYLIKAYVQSVRRGFLQLHVYKIGEDEEYNSASNEFGLMGLYQKLDNLPPNNETINESGIAFKTTSDILYGTTYDLQRTQALALPANVDGGAFRNADGKYIYVLWARTQIDQSETANATYDFPTALGLQALYRRDWDHSTTGRQMVIPATGVALTGSPIFLMEQAQVLMPPVAAFSADQPWGCEGMEVRFQEEAARADRFLWTFPGGNPASSTAASPRVRYQSSGTYPVTLEVFNNAGKHAATYQRFIEVRTTPNSDFTFEVDGNWVDFTSVVGYDDSISYFWSYGDGYTSPGVDPDHYYFDNGAYEAQLIATNSCGSDTTTKTVYIKNPPIAQFSRVVSSYCPPHQVLFLDLSPSDPEVWEWEFPGGFPASSSEANPEIEYAQAGWYEARLIVYNSFGSDTTSQRFYLAAGTEEQLREQLCDDEELLVNGTIYNAANPSGTEVIPGVGLLGCDSIIQVDLSIGQSSRSLLASTLCQGEQLVVNGVIYEQSRPNGEETLSGANAEGCDSIVQIALSFHDPAFSTVDPQLCPQEALYINGQLYNQANPQGEEVIVGGSVNGCDSTVVIDLSFHPPAESYLERQLCEGEFVLVNGKRYDQSRPTGTEIIANASKDACDSLVFIDLSFHPPAVEEWTQAHCLSDTVLINGSLYHAGRPNGVELIPGGSIHGCDSSILVDLTFDTAIRQNLSIRLCEGEGYLLGDTYYSLSGTFRDTFAARSGCDSIVELNLQILDDPITNSLDVQLCEGESYNGQGYEQDVVLIDSLVNDIGCDSILYTFVEVAPVQEEFRQVEVCEGRRYHGIRYFADTVITEVYSNAYNCDSSVTTTIDVLPGSFSVLVDTIELGQSYWVGNSSYEQTGSYVDTLVNSLGCDSIVFLELTVLDLVSVGSSVSAVSLQLKAQPNPFVSSIALQFELPTASEVRLELLDVHGRHLWSLIEGVAYPSGSHQIDCQKAHLPPGLYWCRLQAGNQQAVIKLIKL